MASTNTGFAAFLGVAAVVAAVSYFVVPMVFPAMETTETQGEQSAIVSGADQQGAPAQENAPAQETAAVQPGQPSAPATPTGPESWTAPRFDILRVEPDGSAVIAGAAEPGKTVDLMNGDTVVASSQTGATGDFAIVLDEPLQAGDYQLTLRLRGEDGGERLSEEVATVSVPSSGTVGLLAMVAKPGEASRILAQPQVADPAPGQETASSDEASDAGTADDMKAAETMVAVAPRTEAPASSGNESGSETSSDATSADDTPAATGDQASAEAGTPAGETSSDAAQVAAGESTLPLTPDLPAASGDLFASAPGMGDAAEEAPQELAAVDTAAGSAAQTMADATVRIDAVEIEGGTIFVAGSATPGATVRIDADGIPVGSVRADETGRFIVEAEAELSVGDHIISADLIAPGSDTVILRAEVPFNRPAGQALAAVAPAASASDAPAANPAPAADAPSPAGELVLGDLGQLSALREDAYAALESYNALAAAEAPDAGALSDARDTVVAILQTMAAARLADSADVALEDMAEAMRAQAVAALQAIEGSASADNTAGSASLPSGDDMAAMRAAAQDAIVALTTPAAESAGASPDAGADAGSQPRTIVQAPLQSAPQAVIIRRGDTLWQIARRTYGQGVRYTTIYLANRSQIRNPDRIAPGQVFSVPENYLDNAEEEHRRRVTGQSDG